MLEAPYARTLTGQQGDLPKPKGYILHNQKKFKLLYYLILSFTLVKVLLLYLECLVVTILERKKIKPVFYRISYHVRL